MAMASRPTFTAVEERLLGFSSAAIKWVPLVSQGTARTVVGTTSSRGSSTLPTPLPQPNVQPDLMIAAAAADRSTRSINTDSAHLHNMHTATTAAAPTATATAAYTPAHTDSVRQILDKHKSHLSHLMDKAAQYPLPRPGPSRSHGSRNLQANSSSAQVPAIAPAAPTPASSSWPSWCTPVVGKGAKKTSTSHKRGQWSRNELLEALQRERSTHAWRVTELENRAVRQEQTIKEGQRAYVDIEARLGTAVFGLAQLEDRVAAQAHTDVRGSAATLTAQRRVAQLENRVAAHERTIASLEAATLTAQRRAAELENRVAARERTVQEQAQALAELSKSTTFNVETGEDEVELPLVAEAISRKRRRETTPASALGKVLEARDHQVRVKVEQLKAADAGHRQKYALLEDETNCTICMAQRRSIAFTPCNHFICCHECSAQLADCPFCSQPITRRYKLYT